LSIGETASFCQVCGTPVDTAAPPVAEPDTAVLGAAGDAPEDAASRRMGEVMRLLQDASGCESTDASRAADLYREAICGCLEAGEDPLGSEDVRRDLLHGFDRLSSVLQREGLPAEALDVVDSAASLGLLDAPCEAGREHLGALRDRRESLRHILHADSAQL
jgi:hypothetical protein